MTWKPYTIAGSGALAILAFLAVMAGIPGEAAAIMLGLSGVLPLAVSLVELWQAYGVALTGAIALAAGLTVAGAVAGVPAAMFVVVGALCVVAVLLSAAATSLTRYTA